MNQNIRTESYNKMAFLKLLSQPLLQYASIVHYYWATVKNSKNLKLYISKHRYTETNICFIIMYGHLLKNPWHT